MTEMNISELVLLLTCLVLSGVKCQDDFTCKTAELLEGRQGKIYCLPRRGLPFGTRWSRGNQDIVDGNEFRIENDGLVILNVSRSHSGTYRVHWVDRDTGTESLKDATVEVVAPAMFPHPNWAANFRLNGNATLEKEVDGLPKPTCRWYDKLGNPVRNTEKTSVGDCSLFIQDLTLDDAQTYTCIATNKLGTATGMVTLTLDGKADPDKRPEPLHSLEQSSVTSSSLSVDIEGPHQGEPVVSVQCIYGVLKPRTLPNEQSITWALSPGKNTYKIENLREGFVYRLHCASVSLDTLIRSDWSPNLDVKLTPPAPKMWLRNLDSLNLDLVWNVPVDNRLYDGNEVQEYQLSYTTVWLQDNQWIESSGSCPVVVTLCTSSWNVYRPGKDTYKAKVRARNQAGWSEWSQEVIAGQG